MGDKRRRSQTDKASQTLSEAAARFVSKLSLEITLIDVDIARSAKKSNRKTPRT
jgi:hypothetical protein